MPGLSRKQHFCLSGSHHGLQRADEGLALGQQQLTHLLHLGHPASTKPAITAALPCRYFTTSPGLLFPQRSNVPKQAFGFCPIFNLAHSCNSSSANASTLASTSREAMIALQPIRETVLMPSSSSALQRLQQRQQQQQHLQQQQQRDMHQVPQEQQQQHKKQKVSQVQVLQQQQASYKPWLGAQLDVGGYTKKGFISGGGKEQNQDRGLILEEFRSPNELLLGVFDGHGSGGHFVSTYLAQHLPAVLMQKLVAAAAGPSSSSSSSTASQPQQKQRQLFGRASRQQQQQQHSHLGQHVDQDLQFAISQVPYVVVPDHWPKYGFSQATGVYAANGTSGPSSTTPPPPQTHGGGRAVGKQQVVEQPHSHALDDLSDGSSSSSSSQQWLSPVSHTSVQQVPLSQDLLTAAFTATDWLLSGSGINVVDSGSTALMCHIGPNSITTAWVGDSRAVLGRRKQLLQPFLKQEQQQQGQEQDSTSNQQQQEQQQQVDRWQAIPLSVDHKPERHDEYLRINLNEGRVAQIMGRGPYRVWFKGIDYPGLAMSRAFGDLPCRRIGVTVEPEVTVHRLHADDEVLIAATDGVWDVLSNVEALSVVGNASGAQAAARMLVEVAEARWLAEEGGYIDDITAVVVRAKPVAGGASLS